MNKKLFKPEFQYALRSIELHTCEEEVVHTQKNSVDVRDDLVIEDVTEARLHFSIKRSVATKPENVLTFFVEFEGYLTFVKTPTPEQRKDLSYWENYLSEAEPNYVNTLLGLASNIISSVTLTFGSRKPLVTQPSLIKDAKHRTKKDA